MNSHDHGFIKIFDGKTLEGWEVDPTYWKAENGSLIGAVTPAMLLARNSFIIWRGGLTTDFELMNTLFKKSDKNLSVRLNVIERWLSL